MRLGVTLIGTALLWGCSSVPPPLSWKAPRFGERPTPAVSPAQQKAYQEALERWSATGELYSRLDTRLFLGATHHSPAFREAQVKFRSALERWPSAEEEKQLGAERADAEAAHEFFVGVHVNDYRYDDFDRKEGTWRVVLVSGEQQTEPSKVERIGRSNLSRRTLYPYLDEFWTAYRYTFPIRTADGAPTIGTDRVLLRFASPLGSEELELLAR